MSNTSSTRGGQPEHPLDLLEDIVAGALAAIGVLVMTGAELAVQAWVDDRPRRQFKRTIRRQRWRHRPGWRRNLLMGEYVVVAGFLITRSVIRFPRAAVRVGRVAAATGWASGVQQARTRRAYQRDHLSTPTTAPAEDQPAEGTASSPPGIPFVSAPPPPQPAPAAAAASGSRWNRKPSPGPRRRPQTGPSSSGPDLLSWLLWLHTRQSAPAAPKVKVPPEDVKVTVTVLEEQPGDRTDGTDGTDAAATAPEGAGAEPVDADVLCTWLMQDGTFCDAVLPDGETSCPSHGVAAGLSSAAAAAPARTSRRWDGEPETARDTRFFDLRESGYTGWIDAEGNPVDEASGGDGYQSTGTDPADQGVPCPACAGAGCQICGTGQVPAWAVDPAHGVVPAPPGFPGASQISGAVLAPVAAHEAITPTGRQSPMSTSTVSTTASTGGPIATELQTIGDLSLEATRAAQAVEQFEALGRLIRTWTTSLPERVQAARFGTKAINSAVAGIAEHGKQSGALTEQLAVLQKAIGQARSLGDHIGSVQAEGDTARYVSQ